MMRILLLTIAVCAALLQVHSAFASDADEIRQLIPAAAGMSLRDFDKLASSAVAPQPDHLDQKTLTLMLLATKVTDDEEAQAEFRMLGDVPKPSKLAEEITRYVGPGRIRIALGPVTMVHADRITDCT